MNDIKRLLIVGLALLAGGVGLLAVSPAEAAAGAANQAISSSAGGGPASSASMLARVQHHLPPIFDFQKYKLLYNKHYPSILDELSRARLFFGRAFQVFVSYVKYKAGQKDKYLALNKMSDWTPEERQNLMERVEVPDNGSDGVPAPPPAGSGSGDQEQLLPAADLSEIELRLEGLQARAGNERKKRSLVGRQDHHQLTVEQLMIGDPANARRARIESPKLRDSIPSNNPDYRQPELDADETVAAAAAAANQMEPMPEEEAIRISRQSGAEFLDRVLHEDREGQQQRSRAPAGDSAKSEVYLDYRDGNCLTPVKDQDRCQSCFLFSPMAVFEYLHCNQTGTLVSFSEQYFLDCGQREAPKYKHCQTEEPSTAIDFSMHYGLELTSHYPYTIAKRSCPYKKSVPAGQMGHTRVDDPYVITVDLTKSNYTANIARYLRERGPLIAGLLLGDDFLDYGGGIDEPKLTKNMFKHSMALIGHGIENGREYWLIRNSFGPSWGLDGYYKLAKDANKKIFVHIYFLKADFSKNAYHSSEKLKVRLMEEDKKQTNKLSNRLKSRFGF